MESAVISDELWTAMEDISQGQTDPGLKSFQDLLRKWSQQQPDFEPVAHAEKHTVQSLSINVTQVCNLHCVYCAAGGDGTYGDPIKRISIERTLPQIGFFLGKAKPNSSFKITYIGGEPLLYPEALQMIHEYAQEICKAKEIHLSEVVVTNGTQFSDKTLAILGSIQAAISISLDGEALINDKLRPSAGGRGVTDKVVEGIHKLMQSKAQGLAIRSVGVSGVFGRNNPDLSSAYEFYRGLGLDWFDFTYDHLEKESSVNQKFISEMQVIMEKAFALGGEKELRKIKLIDGYFEMLDRQIPNNNYCGAGKSLLVIDGRNNLYTCPWLSGQSNEMVGTGQTLFEDKISAYAKDLVELNGCQSCWARSLCGGGCMFIHQNKTGDRHSVDPNFCERTKSLITEALLYYEQCRLQETAGLNERGGIL
jgi:uncharacterized protein